mgnify:CR=1 FL=1
MGDRVLTCALCAAALAMTGRADELADRFQHPDDAARPRAYWFHMSGNITKEGIKADLEWMKRVGIGGFQNFDASLATPQIVEKRLIYMTPEWKDAFLFTTRLADSLGLEMTIAGSPGWSESGGPWVTPAQAMKKLVWSETRIEGGKPFSGKLPQVVRELGGEPGDVLDPGAARVQVPQPLRLAGQQQEIRLDQVGLPLAGLGVLGRHQGRGAVVQSLAHSGQDQGGARRGQRLLGHGGDLVADLQ